jgi:hypothetical protein
MLSRAEIVLAGSAKKILKVLLPFGSLVVILLEEHSALCALSLVHFV